MQVAKEMENLGFAPEADFCSAMSHYIKACDDRGYDPDDRIEMMMPLFRFVMDRVTIPHFPLYGKETTSGLNYNLAEEILCSIQARLCLYLMTPLKGAVKIYSQLYCLPQIQNNDTLTSLFYVSFIIKIE